MKNNTISPLNTLTDEELSAIAGRITYLRSKVLQMTQSQFASRVKISQTYLSLLENNKKEINVPTLLQICKSFHVNLDWMIYGVGGDDSIFESADITSGYLIQTSRENALNELQLAYSLKSNEMDFISWYLSISPEKRQKLAAALRTLSEM
jgi:transcriptional regulator with XRE-family HTH domain